MGTSSRRPSRAGRDSEEGRSPERPGARRELDPCKYVGYSLRRTRRRKNITLDQAAADTRIRKEYLVRMEAGDFSFQGPVYVRGFLTEYARSLGMDAVRLLNRLADESDAAAEEAHALATSPHVSARPYREPGSRLTRALTVGAGAVLVLMVIGVLFGGRPSEEKDQAALPVSSPQTSVAPTPPPPAAGSTGKTSAARKLAPITEQSRPVPRKTSVRLVASHARCWVQAIVDGDVEYQGMMEVGDAHSFATTGNLTLRLGFPAGVDIIVNGRNLGSPGGTDVRTIALPSDLAALRGSTSG